MADATLSEMANRVLQKLSVLERGEVAEAEDAALIGAVILSVNESLREKGVCYWSDAAFPKAILEALAEHVACHAECDYPSSRNLQKYGGEDKKRMTLAELRALTASQERVDAPSRAIYF
jgi:hypothetical protein